MKLKVTPFGRGGLHIVTPRKLGFKEDMEVEIILPTDQRIDEERIREIVQEEIREFQRDY